MVAALLAMTADALAKTKARQRRLRIFSRTFATIRLRKNVSHSLLHKCVWHKLHDEFFQRRETSRKLYVSRHFRAFFHTVLLPGHTRA
jgi:hypothetical protein